MQAGANHIQAEAIRRDLRGGARTLNAPGASREEGSQAMPAEPAVTLPELEERVLPRDLEDADNTIDDPYIVILYNDDYHCMDEVVAQLQKATGYALERCVKIMIEAHTRGRAIAYTGTESDCE